MSDTSHNDPRPGFDLAATQHALYAELAITLRHFVGGRVGTSDANLDDACGFAWTQLVATSPSIGESIFAWLAQVAIREAWRLHRLDLRETSRGDDAVVDAIESKLADAEPAERVDLAEVAEVIATIHPRKRRMLLLHATGFSLAEIAEEYGISVERARQLVWRARRQVRERIDQE